MRKFISAVKNDFILTAIPVMKFSILIANYNNGKYFKDCYDSLVAQTYTDWEAIIVDDGSTDDSANVISAIIKDDTRFKIFFNETNKGCGFSKRRCVELAEGDIGGFLDPDDTLIPEALKLMAKAHIDHPEVSLVHSNLFFCDESLQQISVYNRAKSVTVSDTFLNLDAAVTHFASFKVSFYNSNTGIDPDILRAVDQDLYLKLSETGPFHFIDKPLYNYRIHNEGISTSKADHALYWFLKVIMKAEERRSVNLEDQIADFLNRSDPGNLEINLGNPRYLILAMIKACKNHPLRFFRKLFLNKS